MKFAKEIYFIVSTMEHVKNVETVQTIDEEVTVKKSDECDGTLQGAVDIVDHYAKCDSRELNESSDSSMPVRPARKFSEYSIESSPASRKSSECLDSSPMKPTRKLSQTSTNRKFSTTSETSIRTPKKVSFSDDLPMAGLQIDEESKEYQSKPATHDEAIQMTSEYLNTLHSAAIDNPDDMESSNSSNDDDDINDGFPLSSSSSGSQVTYELTKADMFPNSRKVSMLSERSFEMNPMPPVKSNSDSSANSTSTITASTSPMDTFLEIERKMSTSSVKSKYYLFSL